MLDIRLIRESPDVVRRSFERRGDKESAKKLDELLKLDKQNRELIGEIDRLRKQRNDATAKVAQLKKEKKSADKELKEAQKISSQIKEKEERIAGIQNAVEEIVRRLPNLVHESVPDGPDENHNVPIRVWGKPRVWKSHENQFKEQTKGLKAPYGLVSEEPKAHADIVEEYDLADMKTAADVAGTRFFFEKGDLARLDLAISMFAIDKLAKKGFTLTIPPFMTRQSVPAGATVFEAFEDTIYKIEGEDLYLIPTSEHVLTAMNKDRRFLDKDLPVKLSGFSPCFRKEAGSHGKDTKGIFRVHQFNKVEQLVFCRSDQAYDVLEELTENSEEILKDLEIPYRVILLCAGDMDKKVTKQYDIEGWFPSQGKFRELGSFGTVMDWATRNFNIKHWKAEGSAESKFACTVYATATANQRLLCAILENHMQKDGTILIPKALHPYMGGVTKIKPKKG